MSTKYTMLEREISDINLDKEDHKNENHLAIHRTKNCVIYYETQKPSKKSESQNCGFRSEIGKVFRPHGAIRQVTPIYNKISKTYFNENYIKVQYKLILFIIKHNFLLTILIFYHQ